MLRADFRQDLGPLRRLNGVNTGPCLYMSRNRREEHHALWRALNTPLVRLHDIPWENPGMQLVDIHHIFPNFKADANDPEQYYFKQTDDYIRQCRALRSDVLYRLGPSIEHSLECYHIFPPEDEEKWIQICINIIRHYNEGWADGFGWDIRYWEIWNEPNLHGYMWKGSDQAFFSFYSKVSQALKKRFPHLKIGGAGLADCNYESEQPTYLDEFLGHCQRSGAVLDFFSVHRYSAELSGLLSLPDLLKDKLSENGFPDSEIIIDEWHYFPGDWSRLADPDYAREMMEGEQGVSGLDAAAFLAAVLSGWQNTPLHTACYYSSGTLFWGLFDRYHKPYKTYYAFKAFGSLLDFKAVRVAAQSSADTQVLAIRYPDVTGAILLSCFKSSEHCCRLQLDGCTCPEPVIDVVDENRNLSRTEDFCLQGNTLELPVSAGSSVYRIRGIRLGEPEGAPLPQPM